MNDVGFGEEAVVDGNELFKCLPGLYSLLTVFSFPAYTRYICVVLFFFFFQMCFFRWTHHAAMGILMLGSMVCRILLCIFSNISCFVGTTE